jgi:GT2 family glycosyltransferase
MLSILIINWNTRDLLRACLFSLRHTCRDLEHEIIVVDNASHDGSAGMVRDEFPEVLLLANVNNRGYAAGNNEAYARSSGECIWLLNPDTEVLPGAPQALLQFLETHPHCGAVASMLVDAQTGHPQRSCRTFPTPAALWVEALGLARRFPRSRRFGFYRMGWWNYAETCAVEQPMASSLLLRRQAIDDSGGLFDEQFPIYFNDVDLAWRLHLAGWLIWYVPEAKVLHHGGASTRQVRPAMIRESHRSLRLFYEKHWRSSMNPLLFTATLLMMQMAGALRVALAERRQQAP